MASAKAGARIPVAKPRGDRLASLLSGGNLGLQLGCTLIDDLQLRQVRVQNTNNLGDL